MMEYGKMLMSIDPRRMRKPSSVMISGQFILMFCVSKTKGKLTLHTGFLSFISENSSEKYI